MSKVVDKPRSSQSRLAVVTVVLLFLIKFTIHYENYTERYQRLTLNGPVLRKSCETFMSLECRVTIGTVMVEKLSIYALVPADYLPSQDSQSEDWSWSVDTVLGINQSMRPQELDLETLSKLIVVNAAGSNDSALVDLWWRWGERLRADLLDYSDDEVSVIEFEALSASDMTYERLLTTEVIDF